MIVWSRPLSRHRYRSTWFLLTLRLHQHTKGPRLSHPDIVAFLHRLPQRRRRRERIQANEFLVSSGVVPRWKEREHALRTDLKDLSRALSVMKSEMWESCEAGDVVVVKPVHWMLACLERCVEKMGKYFDDPTHDPTLQTYALETVNATQLNPLWRAWYMASRNHIPTLISALDVWNKILFMSQMVKGLDLLDTVTFSWIMQSAIQQVSADRAPLIAEDMLRNLQNLKVGGNRCTPTIVIYNQVLQAWSKSGHGEAAKRIHALLLDLKQNRIRKNTITYNILLRYFAGRGDCTRLSVIWNEMLKLQDFVIDLSHRSQMVYGYAKSGNTDQAETFLDQMMESKKHKDAQDAILLIESIHVLLKAYRKILHNDVSGEARWMILHRLQSLQKKIRRQRLLNKSIHTTILDIQSEIGSQDCVAFEESPDNMDAVQLSILLKNYGKRNLPHAATKLFLERLYTRGFDVDVHAFNTILNVWSESSDHDALQQAFDLFSRLLTDSICKQRGIFPDDVSVSVMIKCISRSKSKQVGKILNGVLDLLILKNSEASEENRITLNVVLCNVAIKSCLDSGDWDTAIMILHRMKATKSLADPDVRTYNTLLSNLARKGTESASQRAKRIFFELLKASSSDSNLSLKPNLFSYNLVLKAMCSPRAVKASEEIWRIWAKMENDESVTPNNTTFKILLAFYSKTDDPIFLRRADHLLQSMLTCSTKIHQLRLNHTHFAPIIRRWILDGDTEKAKSVLLQITNLHIERKNPIKPPNPTIFFWTLQGFVGKGELIKAFELVCTVQKLMERGYLGSGFDTKARDYFIRSWEKSNHPERNVYIDKLRNSMKFINN